MADTGADAPKVPTPSKKATNPLSETAKKKLERNKLIKQKFAQRKLKIKQKNVELRKALKARTIKHYHEYEKQKKSVIKAMRLAKKSDGFYKPAEPKIALVVRIKGINKIPPKPKSILRLLRLRQLHNAVFVKLNKATSEMLNIIKPYVTFGYPTLSTIRKLIYKRGYARVGPTGCRQRIRITSNEIIRNRFERFNITGIEDIIHEIFTCGPHFKEVNNFLWPFKLSSPRKGFIAKRHGFVESKGGDWGNREELINGLVARMN